MKYQNKTGQKEPMPKSRAADMARSRARKRAAGLVEFRAWVTPKEKKMLAEALNKMRNILKIS